MKLIKENISKFKFLLFIIVIFLEVMCFSIVIFLYKPIYIQTLENTKNYTINKTISATKTLNDLQKINLYRYLCDLKLIGKHMSFLINKENDNKYIKRTSNYYKTILINEDKKIVYGTMEQLRNELNLSKFYNEKEKKFDYFSYYNKQYIETGKQAQIINSLKNKTLHPELNMIAYYKLNGSINISLLDNDKTRAAKYIISIFKTNIIKRFITRGINYEFMNYILFIEDEMYIYPPEAFNNTHFFYISNLSCFNCKYGLALEHFPKCVYEYVNKKENNFVSDIPGYLRPSIFESKINYEKISINFCITIPFIKDFDLYNLTYNPFLCQESNLTKFFYRDLFEQKDNFEFIFFFIDLDKKNDIIPIYNDKKGRYEEIKTIFNNQKFKKYSISINSNNGTFSLFHFLYIDIFKDSNSFYNLEISIDDIIKEYEGIREKIFIALSQLSNNKTNGERREEGKMEFRLDSFYKVIEIEKTICKNNIYKNNMTCLKDSFLFVIYPNYGNFSLINEFFIEDMRYPVKLPLFYSLSIISNNNKYMKWKIKNIMILKILKLFIFYIIVSISIMYIYFILVQIFYETRYDTINKISDIIEDGLFFEIEDKKDILDKKESILIEPNNKDMVEIKTLFDNMVKSMLLKFNFDERNICSYSSKKKLKKRNSKRQNKSLDSLNEYINLLKSKSNPETKIMSIFIISYGHFIKGYYKLAENELKNLILELNSYENKMSDKNEDNDSKLKDSLSRCSKISYLNEFSLSSGIILTTLPLIKAKLLKQRMLYLYALCIYNQEKTENSNNNINENKKNKNEITKKRYEEAIKYFNECKNISSLLGTDTIREIYSLIMISKCYKKLKNYKESMIHINEALLLYSDLQKTFKDKTYFYPKVMLFTENFIFQSIMLSLSQTIYSFNKFPQSCWILMKIIETSPFVFNNIHSKACFMLNNCLIQLESNYNIPQRQLDKYRKNINKIYSRINIRKLNKEKIVNKELRMNTYNNTTKNITSNPSISNTQVNSISIFDNHGINLKKLAKRDFYTNKLNISSIGSANPLSRNKFKNITLCISEKIIMNINGEELKDVLIKFFQKYFINCLDDDKFAFIQFSYNGKKTISIKSESLDLFLQKLESNKGAFQINENYNKTINEMQFMEFSNLFLSILRSQRQSNFEERIDHIIIIFINTEDIRFNSKKECVDTINELNNNYYTLIIFTYDTNISKDKISSIHSFLCGLNDGHFLQIKNYQQIKQVFMNFSIKESQEKFANYYYEITDYML